MTKILNLYKNLLDIAVTEFKTVVESGEVFYSQGRVPWKLRLYLCDGSFIDVYNSGKGKYSYHWDRRMASPILTDIILTGERLKKELNLKLSEALTLGAAQK